MSDDKTQKTDRYRDTVFLPKTSFAMKAGLPADVSTVLFKMDFEASAKNRDAILERWKKDLER